ncbi:MAG TPA: DUF1326 domain-containing protein [Roseiflexaceae bacterium]|nr:DUF1326 domain-containing protein [Roseiflexaceae bacterium]
MSVATAPRYLLEGRLLEVCDCGVLCPCWVGEDPDNGTCDSALAYHFDHGVIEGVDVSGLTFAVAGHIPGNILAGNYEVVFYVDDRATPEQEAALLKVWSGALGGPLAEGIKLIGTVVAVKRAPITFTVEHGKGALVIGQAIDIAMQPYRGPSGAETTLNESIFSTIPGSPAYVSKADHYTATVPELNWSIDLRGRNAIQGHFRFVAE